MAMQSTTTRARLGRDGLLVPERGHLQASRKPIVVTFTLLAFAILTLVTAGVIAASRTWSNHAFSDLPQRLLPGSKLPGDPECSGRGTSPLACVVHQDGKD